MLHDSAPYDKLATNNRTKDCPQLCSLKNPDKFLEFQLQRHNELEKRVRFISIIYFLIKIFLFRALGLYGI